jgi:predicted  nucleic acid-binding Zn-ribbon protein
MTFEHPPSTEEQLRELLIRFNALQTRSDELEGECNDLAERLRNAEADRDHYRDIISSARKLTVLAVDDSPASRPVKPTRPTVPWWSR